MKDPIFWQLSTFIALAIAGVAGFLGKRYIDRSDEDRRYLRKRTNNLQERITRLETRIENLENGL